ncbi:MAG: 16S rRNA (adenine(1518)-N(6)/adenine(1519)-N(6))-dimethyltransferase RsmA [Bacteroidales bacterium]|nr:16S rRNA (adenine(1518)-N(6)/adenine(1519)-N(6))-dimethyltransferase RsmA [Bacteroidales bacterium]
MEVRAKKSLGQHFLTDQDIARRIVDSLQGSPVLEVGPGMGVLTRYLIPRMADVTGHQLKAVEIDKESVAYLRRHFPELGDGLIEGDFLKMDLATVFPGQFSIIGNFPYNISSQIFFKIIDNRDLVPEVVCMIQKEVAERIAEKPGTKTYGILSVFLQAWYDIEYLFTVGSGAFNPPPKVQSAVIRLTRNSRTELGCDEKLFKTVVKTAFGQRRKTLRNSLKPLVASRSSGGPRPPQDDNDASGTCHSERSEESPLSDPVFDLRPERLSVEDFIDLTLRLSL